MYRSPRKSRGGAADRSAGDPWDIFTVMKLTPAQADRFFTIERDLREIKSFAEGLGDDRSLLEWSLDDVQAMVATAATLRPSVCGATSTPARQKRRLWRPEGADGVVLRGRVPRRDAARALPLRQGVSDP